MKASYKKLWKLLVDKEMSKGDLHKASGLSASTAISVTLWSLWTKASKSPLYGTANMIQ